MNVPLSASISAPPQVVHSVPARCSSSQRLLTLAFALIIAASPALSAERGTARATSAEVAEKRTDLKELRGQIESLRKEMAAAEGKRASAADQLKEMEREISVTQRDLHNLSAQRGKLQVTLKELGKQAQELEERLGHLHAQLENLVYHQYLQGNPDALRLLLNGENPNQLARDLYYLGAIGRARSQMLKETAALLERKTSLAQDTQARTEELSSIEARQKEQHGKLVAQREQHKAVLERISSKISEQRKEIGNLQRDEKQLAQLIERLNRIIASRPAPRKESAPRAAQSDKRPTNRESASEIANEATPEAAFGSFTALKGSLRLPVRGVVTNRFGTSRQEGSTWKGLFIRAQVGSDIKAIAGGRVVFAEWMRGFGNLLIVDHGGSYLSIYGYNDAMLKQVGDSVRGGDSIATAGNSGGNPESGLYFEIRHQGQPIDPLKWVNLK